MKVDFFRVSVFASLILGSLLSAFGLTAAITAAWLWLWLAAGAWQALDKHVWPKGGLPGVMLVFFLWVTASVWWSLSPYTSWYTSLVLGALPMSFLAWQLTPNRERVWSFLRKSFVAGVWLVSLWGLYQVLLVGAPRATGPVADPNVYACLLNLAWFPLLGALYERTAEEQARKPVVRCVIWVSLLVVCSAFFAASSRGATLAWLLVMPLALWAFRYQPHFRKKTLLVSGLVLFGYLVIAAIQGQVADRAGIDYLRQDASVGTRFVMWKTTAEMTLHQPWLGTGLGSWGEIYPAFRSAADYNTAGYFVHNDYLQIAQEGGLATIAIFAALCVLVMRFTFQAVFTREMKAVTPESVGLMLGVAAAFMHATVNFIFYLVFLNIIIGLYLGRAWQTAFQLQCTRIAFCTSVGLPVRRLFVVFVAIIPLAQIGLHETAEAFLNGNNHLSRSLRVRLADFSPYGIARTIAAIRPQEYIAQRYLLETAVEMLGDIDPRDVLLRKGILEDALGRYEVLRQNAKDYADLSADEARLLLTYRTLLPGDSAILKARSVLNKALDTNPRHVASLIALAESYRLEGEPGNSQRILAAGISKMIFVRDRLILQAELLKYYVTQEDLLLASQKRLRDLKFACKVYECGENQVKEKEERARLSVIARSVPSFSDPVVANALESLQMP